MVFPYQSAKAELRKNDGVIVKDCYSAWSGDLGAAYPFIPVAPNISMGGTISFSALGYDLVQIKYDLYHDHFPDYEVMVYVGGTRVSVDLFYSPSDTPKTLAWWATAKQSKSVFTIVPTPKCCKGTCGN